jgi:hypothetical protein
MRAQRAPFPEIGGNFWAFPGQAREGPNPEDGGIGANGEASLVTRQTGKAMPICPAMAHARRGGPSGDAGEHGDGADNRRATLHAAVGDVFKIVGRRSVSEQCGLNCRYHHSMHAKWAGDE